jgi:hypothetical protein
LLERPDNSAEPRLPLPPVALALGNDRAGKHGFDSRFCVGRAGRRSRHAKDGQIVAPAGKHAVLDVVVCFYVLPVFFLLRGGEELGNVSDRFFQRRLSSGTLSGCVPVR